MVEIKMVDLQRQYNKIKNEIDAALLNVVTNANFINGVEVQKFTSELARFLDIKHVIPCANGTDALQLALMALDLPKDSEILVPSFSYIAAAEAVAMLGLKPVFVDALVDTFNIDPIKIEIHITDKTKAMIPVHLFGQTCDMLAILKIAQKHNLFVIEDNAQSLGAIYHYPDGSHKMAGTMGHIGTTSFFPSKNLGCMGDGGAVFTNDDILVEKIKTLANHGQKTRYLHEIVGMNSRLDTMQAAVLSVKIKYLKDYTTLRQLAATKYDAAFINIEGLTIPERSTHSTHVFHQYTLKVENGKREQLKDFLEQKDIPSMIYYPLAIHQQKGYEKYYAKAESLGIAEKLANEVLSLPMHTELDEIQFDYICKAVKDFFEQK